MKHWVRQEYTEKKRGLFGRVKYVKKTRLVQVDGKTYRSMKRAEKKEKRRLKDEAWERRMRAEELEEEYDEIDGIEDADY